MGKRKQPVKLSAAWSGALVPLLLVVAGLSIPYGAIKKRVQRHREQQFLWLMKSRGRVIDWGSVTQKANQGNGTVLTERFSFKGPVRFWWTAENVYDACPYPLVDWLSMSRDEQFQDSSRWCRKRYTSPESGNALLIHLSPNELRTIYRGMTLAEGIRWLEVAPPRT